jgi:hypothetical protein
MTTRERQRLSDQAATEEMNSVNSVPRERYQRVVHAVSAEIDYLSRPNGMHSYNNGYHAKGCAACALRDRLRAALRGEA